MTSIESLVGIYDADGTVLGEIRYWIGARLGRTHCSLCEITHGLFSEKSEWRDCRSHLGVPFQTFHRDDAPRAALDVATELPAVLASTTDGYVVILDALELAELDGDVDRFAAALTARMTSMVDRPDPSTD